MYYLYILKCNDGSLYTGITPDLEGRLATHRAGKGSKYVRSRLPVELVYTEEYPNRGAALRREYEIKRLTRTEKFKLMTDGEQSSF